MKHFTDPVTEPRRPFLPCRSLMSSETVRNGPRFRGRLQIQVFIFNANPLTGFTESYRLRFLKERFQLASNRVPVQLLFAAAEIRRNLASTT